MSSNVESPSPRTRDDIIIGDPLHDKQLWFKDGTLILRTHKWVFRVYGGLLAAASPIFDDMLEIGQLQDSNTIEGCPVVDLQDDGDDVRYFLRALFDYKCFLVPPAQTHFQELSGILRLSKKYDVKPLHIRAVTHLATAFPTTLDDYPGTSSWTVEKADLIPIVLLARELSIEWVLPLAFYRVCGESTIAEILNGVDYEGRHFELSPEDRLRCLEQHVSLRGSAAAKICDFLWDLTCTYNNARVNADCMASRISARRIVEGRRAEADVLPLNLWRNSDWTQFDTGPCRCVSTMKRARQEALNLFWEDLPERFGLVNWSELCDMKDADLGITTNAASDSEVSG
ncbi:hypothetical protein GGX14DRAFT_673252 [Mycena pura]|uniref:BTB domain-containing protein n=1 Tax=Mycena pura TaxID=153505 RepID=A0AAD6V029_9AGAR|nr:hypothetical protein GGX14DRAFT_673252 [Mycena pura]